jgi:type IV pilus assembly protein PilY1
MNIKSIFASTPRIGRLLATAAAVFAMGLVYPPAIPVAMAATVTVTVDQSPLTLRQPIPPDITLMLDDSGSMAWDVMPDYNYLGATQGSPTASELTSSAVNGLYYNPNTVYGPPTKVDGTLYPAASFNASWVDGFNTGTGTVDLTTYDGSSDTSQQGTSSSNIGYTQSFTVTTSGTPYPPNCKSGYALVGTQCQKQPYAPSCPFGYTLAKSGNNAGKCVSNTNKNKTSTPTCQVPTDTYSSTTFLCTPNPPVYATPTFKRKWDTFDSTTVQCVPMSQRTYSFLT